jgi:hypothetical protein
LDALLRKQVPAANTLAFELPKVDAKNPLAISEAKKNGDTSIVAEHLG